jgi:hypothetical protein
MPTLVECTSNKLQAVIHKLLDEVVAKLHIYSSDYETLSARSFEALWTWSEKCRIKALFELDQVATLLLPRALRLTLSSNNTSIDED